MSIDIINNYLGVNFSCALVVGFGGFFPTTLFVTKRQSFFNSLLSEGDKVLEALATYSPQCLFVYRYVNKLILRHCHNIN